jgi:hypothetical protein
MEGTLESLKMDPARRGTRRDLCFLVEATHNPRSRNINYLGIAMRNGNAEYRWSLRIEIGIGEMGN